MLIFKVSSFGVVIERSSVHLFALGNSLNDGLRLSSHFVDLVDLRRLVFLTLLSGLRLFEDLLRCSELVDGLRWRRTRQVLVGVEPTDRRDVGNVGELEELADALVREEAGLVGPVLAVIHYAGAVVVSAMIVPAVLELDLGRHRRESDALGQIRERVCQSAHVLIAVVEAAVLTKLADLAKLGGLAGLEPVLARDGLVVGVHGAEGGLAEVFGQGLSD